MENDAEQRCEKYVTEALLVAPTSVEALQTLASVRVSQQRVDDAVAALQRSFSLWRDLDVNSAEVPTYASRINLSKLLIETSQHETALEVLERLQLEDDQLPDLWYLGGWCLFLLGEQEPEGSVERLELWETCREWLGNCEKVSPPPPTPSVFGGADWVKSCMLRLSGRTKASRNMPRSCWQMSMRYLRSETRTRKTGRRRSGRTMRTMRWRNNGLGSSVQGWGQKSLCALLFAVEWEGGFCWFGCVE